MVDVAHGNRLKLSGLGIEIHRTSGKPSPSIAIIDVHPPALKRDNEV